MDVILGNQKSSGSLKKLVGQITLGVVNYVIGPTLGLVVCLLEAFGRVRILRFQRFPLWERKLIIVSNHPSLLEPVILPLLGFPWMNFPWLFSPLWTRPEFSSRWLKNLREEFSLHKKLTPANVPDKDNFYNPPLWRLFQGINVPVDRNGGTQRRISTALALKRILDHGGRILIFPEGGRTFKAVQKSKVISANGKQLGQLKDGAAWLALKTGAKVIPIWVEGTDRVLPNNKFPFPRLWHRVTIKIGPSLLIQGTTREEATMEITQALLRAADEEG